MNKQCLLTPEQIDQVIAVDPEVAVAHLVRWLTLEHISSNDAADPEAAAAEQGR